jgi:hypothetical protein
MIYIVGGFFVAMAAVAVPLMLLPGLHVPDYPDISLACNAIAEHATQCRAGAEAAGVTMLAGMAIALVLAVVMARRHGTSAHLRSFAPWTYTAALAIVTTLVAGHVVSEMIGQFSASRVVNISRESTFISLENLAWPVLLQMMNSSRRYGDKLLCLALFLSIAVLSPYRAILLTFAFFGLLLPVLDTLWARARTGRFNAVTTLKYGSALFLILLILTTGIYFQTRGRAVGTAPTSTTQELRQQTKNRLVQRLTYPLFQAHFAQVVTNNAQTPKPADEILKKLRLTDKLNLNEYLYSRIYGTGTVGEMTSLYYGEGAAYLRSPPLIWAVVAPLFFVTIWLLFCRYGYPVETLIGIAIWRGSLGGIVPLLPSLALQLLAVIVLCWKHYGKK